MIDITTAIEIRFGEDQVTYAYRDFQNQDLWYLTPVPRIRTLNGDPVFSVMRYEKNGGGLSGACTFEAELVQPAEAKAALEARLGHPVELGGYTWVGGVAYFHYLDDGVPAALAVSPTLYGTNVAAFQLMFETAEQLNEFCAALSEGGGASPFSVEYDMQVLTMLLGAEAVVEYKADAAISYQETYQTERDTWGNQRQVLVEVKQVLQQSGAGTVEVTIGAGGTPELEGRVREWAWTTLETQVSSTVAAAAAMATAPGRIPVSATTSFKTTYAENTVIDWSTPVSSALAVFPEAVWRDKVLKVVDNRSLSVQFNLIGLMINEQTGLAIAESIVVTVDYPTRTTDNSFVLVPADGGKSTLTYTAPGHFVDDTYDGAFRYKYVIKYFEGGDFESDWIDTDETIVNITPSNFGSRQVMFVGQDIGFGDGDGEVSRVVIDFFFAPPEGHAAKVQVKTMEADGLDGTITFQSYYNLPIGALYSYKLRYMMNSGAVITSEQPVSFSEAPGNTLSGNANIVYIVAPTGLFTQFTPRVMNVAGGVGVNLVDISAQYWDTKNDQGALFNNAWPNWMPKGSPFVESAKPWQFQAVDNTNSAYYKMSGQIIYNSGTIVDLGSSYFQPSGVKTFVISSDSEPYAVKIFTNEIDWDLVENVYVTFFRLEEGAVQRLGGTLPQFLTKARPDMTATEADIALGLQKDVYGYSLMRAVDEQPVDNVERYYALKRPINQQKVEFYYTAQYVIGDGQPTRWIRDQKVEGVLSVNLPPVPPAGSTTPGLVHHVMDGDALRAHLKSGAR